jgi:hypothetical protein
MHGHDVDDHDPAAALQNPVNLSLSNQHEHV